MHPGLHSGRRPMDAMGSHTMLDGAIQRLEEVVEQETAALRTRGVVDLNGFNDRKSQGLLELNRVLRGLDPSGTDTGLVARLAGLRAKLDVNHRALKMHLDAVREITGIMADAIRDSESDGTYSPSIRRAADAYND